MLQWIGATILGMVLLGAEAMKVPFVGEEVPVEKKPVGSSSNLKFTPDDTSPPFSFHCFYSYLQYDLISFVLREKKSNWK